MSCLNRRFIEEKRIVEKRFMEENRKREKKQQEERNTLVEKIIT